MSNNIIKHYKVPAGEIRTYSGGIHWQPVSTGEWVHIKQDYAKRVAIYSPSDDGFFNSDSLNQDSAYISWLEFSETSNYWLDGDAVLSTIWDVALRPLHDRNYMYTVEDMRQWIMVPVIRLKDKNTDIDWSEAISVADLFDLFEHEQGFDLCGGSWSSSAVPSIQYK